jgi:hypothetical protein
MLFGANAAKPVNNAVLESNVRGVNLSPPRQGTDA